jgi:hypothetical protein
MAPSPGFLTYVIAPRKETAYIGGILSGAHNIFRMAQIIINLSNDPGRHAYYSAIQQEHHFVPLFVGIRNRKQVGCHGLAVNMDWSFYRRRVE